MSPKHSNHNPNPNPTIDMFPEVQQSTPSHVDDTITKEVSRINREDLKAASKRAIVSMRKDCGECIKKGDCGDYMDADVAVARFTEVYHDRFYGKAMFRCRVCSNKVNAWRL